MGEKQVLVRIAALLLPLALALLVVKGSLPPLTLRAPPWERAERAKEKEKESATRAGRWGTCSEIAPRTEIRRAGKSG